jgi:carboxyl-terminal processing protease
MTALEAQRLKLEDLGTRRDPQYKVAENTLVKQLNSLKASEMTPAKSGVQAYSPSSSNLPSALSK